MNSNKIDTRKLVMTAFFAAVVYLGIQVFRIPVPRAFGTPFLHFGHIFVILAIVCLGPKLSTCSAVIGYLIFDIANGYMHAIPNVLFCTIIKCMVVGTVFVSMNKKSNGDSAKEFKNVITCSVLYGILSIVLDFGWSVVELMIIGNPFATAFSVELASIPATAINAVFAVIGTRILYKPVMAAYKRVVGK